MKNIGLTRCISAKAESFTTDRGDSAAPQDKPDAARLPAACGQAQDRCGAISCTGAKNTYVTNSKNTLDKSRLTALCY